MLLYWRSLPYCPLDESDDAVKAVIRRARREALTIPEEPSPRLVDLVSRLPLQHLRHARCVVLIRHPGEKAGATGAGGIWAVASRLVNQAADRAAPVFEVVQ